jgi:hypothetical protein
MNEVGQLYYCLGACLQIRCHLKQSKSNRRGFRTNHWKNEASYSIFIESDRFRLIFSNSTLEDVT